LKKGASGTGGAADPGVYESIPIVFGFDVTPVQLFFDVWVMNGVSCGTTSVPLHVGHFTFTVSRSEIVMASSKGFLHFPHRNS
jgi:hypothetical protein